MFFAYLCRNLSFQGHRPLLICRDMKNIFIAFSNQKGGCGKSTLCALFANYLSERGKSVFMGDFDMQRTLASVRELDIKTFEGQALPYAIRAYELAPSNLRTKEDNEWYIQSRLKEMEDYADVIILDTPGNIKDFNLINILRNVDYLITPFSYDRNTWLSMLRYRVAIKVLRNPEKNYNAHFEAFFVLNRYDSRVGTADDHKTWEMMDKIVGKEGIPTPPIKYKADIMRYNTLFLTDKQREAVKPCFDAIYAHIFEGRRIKGTSLKDTKDQNVKNDGKEQ